MSWDDFLNPHEQSEYECYECGADMETKTMLCQAFKLVKF